MLIMGCMHCIKPEQINAAIANKVVDIYSKPPGNVPDGVEDSFGDNNLFNSYFWFRKHKVLCILHALHFQGKSILCGRWKKLNSFQLISVIIIIIWASIVLELLGRRHKGNTFCIDIFIEVNRSWFCWCCACSCWNLAGWIILFQSFCCTESSFTKCYCIFSYGEVE